MSFYMRYWLRTRTHSRFIRSASLAAPMIDALSIKQTLDMHVVLAPAASIESTKVVYEQTRTN